MKKTVNRTKYDQGAAIEQFEKYKETGNGKIVKVSERQVGYSKAYDEGWTRIFGNKEETKEDQKELEDPQLSSNIKIIK